MTMPEPTQVRRPWRATFRTIFQALVGLAAIAPLIAAAIEEATGYDLDGVPFIVVALAAAAALTRVMAIPQVESWLSKFVPWLAADPTDRGEGGFLSLSSTWPTFTNGNTAHGPSRDRALPGKRRIRARRQR